MTAQDRDLLYYNFDYLQQRIEEETNETVIYTYSERFDVLGIRFKRFCIAIHHASVKIEYMQKLIENITERYFTMCEEGY